MSAFERYLAQEIPAINHFLEGATNSLNPLVQPAVRHMLLAGGKRLRPLLTILTARALGYRQDNIYPLACSLELLHTATLLHDCSDGGLAVALAEMAIGGRLGASLDLTAAPAPASLSELELLYAESQSRLVVTIAPEHQAAFEELFTGQPLGLLGAVTEKPVLTLGRNGQQLCAEDVEGLVRAFKATLDW